MITPLDGRTVVVTGSSGGIGRGIAEVSAGAGARVLSAARDALTASGRGRVVVPSSITGPLTGFPGWAHHGASKAAQLGFVRTAAIEQAPRRITVDAVLPGTCSPRA